MMRTSGQSGKCTLIVAVVHGMSLDGMSLDGIEPSQPGPANSPSLKMERLQRVDMRSKRAAPRSPSRFRRCYPMRRCVSMDSFNAVDVTARCAALRNLRSNRARS
uniref:Uncharacterized protein n=1 Tax=Plectus sambesii TaxID=2011161 RepID=A0A914VE28_9BILA